MSTRSDLNKNIERYRKYRGLSMQELGDLLGVTRTTVQRYESGQIHNIDVKTIMKLSKALDCTPAQLAGWESFPATNNERLNELCDLCTNLEPNKLQTIIDMAKVVIQSWG